MRIEGKDFLDWIHGVRRENKRQRNKSGLSYSKWLKLTKKEAETILGKKISKYEDKKAHL